MTRRAFTLIEVITAITLTAIVLGIAGGALSAAGATRTTVLRHQRTLEAESRLRATLSDMLRHVPNAEAVNEPLLRIVRDVRGNAALVFLSNGVREPFGTGHAWRVTLSVAAGGLVMDAVAIGRNRSDALLHTTVPGVDTLQIDVLEEARLGEAAQWRGDWPLERTRPALIRVRFGTAPDAPSPLVVALSPLDAR